jgi:SsrA-binding protein
VPAHRVSPSTDGRPLATHRAASFEYELLQRFEAGLVLTGTEVKSARAGKVNLKEAYGKVRHGEVFLVGAHFSPYSHGTHTNHEPLRERKLLLKAAEIRRLSKETGVPGVTIVPTKLYLKNGRIKIEIALARGKRQHDKRETSRDREVAREIARARGTSRTVGRRSAND